MPSRTTSVSPGSRKAWHASQPVPQRDRETRLVSYRPSKCGVVGLTDGDRCGSRHLVGRYPRPSCWWRHTPRPSCCDGFPGFLSAPIQLPPIGRSGPDQGERTVSPPCGPASGSRRCPRRRAGGSRSAPWGPELQKQSVPRSGGQRVQQELTVDRAAVRAVVAVRAEGHHAAVLHPEHAEVRRSRLAGTDRTGLQGLPEGRHLDKGAASAGRRPPAGDDGSRGSRGQGTDRPPACPRPPESRGHRRHRGARVPRRPTAPASRRRAGRA